MEYSLSDADSVQAGSEIISLTSSSRDQLVSDVRTFVPETPSLTEEVKKDRHSLVESIRTPTLTMKEAIERDLERMRLRDEAAAGEMKIKRAKDKAKIIADLHDQRIKRGVTIFPATKHNRQTITAVIERENFFALEEEKAQLEEETKRIQQQIDEKYAVSNMATGSALLTSTAEFYGRKPPTRSPIPNHVQRELTYQEISDLKVVFDMFDLREKGYITPTDLRRAIRLLGFKAGKEVFKIMLGELPVEDKGKLSFINFLEFVIKSQGDGPDPLEEIFQGFRMLDKGEKGYLTFDDLRTVSDDLDLALSDLAIREMIQEADNTGNGTIRPEQFVQIMLQTNRF